MTIQVIAPYDYGQSTSVMFEDECDHAGAEIEMLEYDKPSWYADAHCYVNDDSEELPTLVCKCGYEELQEPEEPDYERED